MPMDVNLSYVIFISTDKNLVPRLVARRGNHSADAVGRPVTTPGLTSKMHPIDVQWVYIVLRIVDGRNHVGSKVKHTNGP